MSLISNWKEKKEISIIGSFENPISGDNTSMGLRINVKCLENYLKEVSNVKEIYNYLYNVIRNYGPITFYHKFRLSHKEKDRTDLDISTAVSIWKQDISKLTLTI